MRNQLGLEQLEARDLCTATPSPVTLHSGELLIVPPTTVAGASVSQSSVLIESTTSAAGQPLLDVNLTDYDVNYNLLDNHIYQVPAKNVALVEFDASGTSAAETVSLDVEVAVPLVAIGGPGMNKFIAKGSQALFISGSGTNYFTGGVGYNTFLAAQGNNYLTGGGVLDVYYLLGSSNNEITLGSGVSVVFAESTGNTDIANGTSEPSLALIFDFDPATTLIDPSLDNTLVLVA